MTTSPTTLLAKLDELKKWQEAQQERLLRQHNNRLEAVNNEFPYTLSSGNNISSYEDATNENHDLNEIQTKSPKDEKNSFHVLKQPYLKRGSGLEKYGLQFGEHKKPFNKMKPKNTTNKPAVHKRIEQIKTFDNKDVSQGCSKQKSLQIIQQLKVDANGAKENELQEIVEHNPSEILSGNNLSAVPQHNDMTKKNTVSKDITPLKIPDVTIHPKAKWCPVQENLYEPTPQDISDKSEDSIQNIDDNDRVTPLCNLNTPLQILQNNPELLQCLQRLASSHFGSTSSLDHTDLLNKLTLNESTLYQTPNNNNNPELIRYLQNLLQKYEHHPPGDLTSYENAIERELRVFEQLEEKAMNSSFCSTTSSIAELLASTPNKIIKVPTFATIQEGCNLLGNKVSQGTQSSYTEGDSTMQNRNAKKQLTYPNNQEYSDESSVTSEDFDRTVQSCDKSRIVLQNAGTMTDPAGEVNEDVLKHKLQELQNEISNFRTESGKLEKTKSELERERLQLKRSAKSLEKEYQDRREQLEFELEEDRKKFNKEKNVFEKYRKDLQNKPNRKEREEISTLKGELANVKEALKVKEARSGTTQARLRTQLKSLEKENGNLKEEVEKLQKHNARLQNLNHIHFSRKPNAETKMLHEINKNLSKLTKDQKVAKVLNKLETSLEEKHSSEDSLVLVKTKHNKSNPVKMDKQVKKKVNINKNEEYYNNIKSRIGGRSSLKSVSDDSSTDGERQQDIKSSQKAKPRKSNNSDYETEYKRSYSKSSYTYDPEHDNSDGSCASNSSVLGLRSKLTKSRSRSSLESKNNSIDNKENDRNLSNGDITTFRNLSDLCVSDKYEKVFGVEEKDAIAGNGKKLTRHNSLNDTQQSSSKIEMLLIDGSKETKYPNGNIKTVSPDGNFIRMEYFNGDIKETQLLQGTIKYFYKDTQIWQSTFSSGDETFEFPDGQVEKHFADGSSHVQFPNGISKHVQCDGSEQINYPDGSVVNIKENGEKVLQLPNGQKEIHTDAHKRREYPDGTVKIIYPDGLQETRYSNGRIRMKDKDGNLIMDSHKD